MKIVIKEEGILADLLMKAFESASKTTVKGRIVHGNVRVNGKMTTNPSIRIKPGDEVEYKKQKVQQGKKMKSPYPVLYEDDYLLVAEKPAGLLTIGDRGLGGTSFYQIMQGYLKEKSKGKERLFVVHRIDREVSGVLLFTKSEKIQEQLKTQWWESKKRYYALVEGQPKDDQGTIRSWLIEGHDQKVYSTKIQDGAKLAITHYRVMDRTPDYALLEVELETGRKNQIRVHLSELGCPVVGDRRYGADAQYERRIRLHAFYLAIRHPETGELIEFKSKMPKGFLVLKPGDEKYK
ncbi:MAG: RluA family pseudouridine synthase [Bacteroidales bacterium]|nr:RluA family pseudouridine synthase [Bacteroidales bacterium]MDD4602431.1 RluA family pseudouridine synthase [Bacteroidales bacterium]